MTFAEKSQLNSTAYQALLQHSWLREELAQVVDLEQAGYAIRADFDLCYAEPIQNTPNKAMLDIALDGVNWQRVAWCLAREWGIRIPKRRR